LRISSLKIGAVVPKGRVRDGSGTLDRVWDKGAGMGETMKELISALLLASAVAPASQRGFLGEASTFSARESEGKVLLEAAPPRAESAALHPALPSSPEIPHQGEWEVACELKSGKALLFDRRSVRDLSGVRLFRWAVAGEADPVGENDDPHQGPFTGVAHCRDKALEAVWPGKMAGTKAGTAGRRLVDSVCARNLSPPPVRGARIPPRH
jgi:hypothetical protein